LTFSLHRKYNSSALIPLPVKIGLSLRRIGAGDRPTQGSRKKGHRRCQLSAFPFVTSSPLFAIDFVSYSSPRSTVENTVKNMYCSPHAHTELLPDAVLAILYICAIHCMRISELLLLRARDYLGEGRWLVRGLKRSRSYTIWLNTLAFNTPLKSALKDNRPIIEFPYKYVWSWCRRAGIGTTPAGRSTVARTHAHRYLTAKKVASVAPDAAASDVMHHNSKRSLQNYTK